MVTWWHLAWELYLQIVYAVKKDKQRRIILQEMISIIRSRMVFKLYLLQARLLNMGETFFKLLLKPARF